MPYSYINHANFILFYSFKTKYKLSGDACDCSEDEHEEESESDNVDEESEDDEDDGGMEEESLCNRVIRLLKGYFS